MHWERLYSILVLNRINFRFVSLIIRFDKTQSPEWIYCEQIPLVKVGGINIAGGVGGGQLAIKHYKCISISFTYTSFYVHETHYKYCPLRSLQNLNRYKFWLYLYTFKILVQGHIYPMSSHKMHWEARAVALIYLYSIEWWNVLL